MSEAGGSVLAITEKRTQRTSAGGCVGVFFQLFDWNRRFAKKKLFLSKLLPLGSKKFGTDDKLPKLRLMSDEKNESFSNGKKNGARNVDSGQKQVMRTPTLVARLMGLDSLPAVQRNKSKKSYEIGVDKGDKFASDCCPFDSQQRKLEKEGSKHESRPQKLQKTGVSEKGAVSRFGAEGLQFKSVLSRSSKHHPPKFVSPVKSPKSLSKKNASRLIGAATRILEPGLQARNRAKCSLPYPSQRHHNPTDGHLFEAGTDVSKDQVGTSTYYENEVKLSRGQTSCENYGKFVDVLESRSYLEKRRSISDYMDCSSFGFESRQSSSLSSLEPDNESIFLRNPEKSTDFDFQSHRNVNPRAEHNLNRTALQKGGQTRWQLTSQQYTKQEASPSSFCYNQKICVRDQGLDRIPPRSMYSVELSEETLNQRPIGRSSRMHGKFDNCRHVSERRSTDRRYDPLSSARKRRSVNVARQGDVCSFAGSPVNKQRNSNCNALGQTIVRGDDQSTNLPCIGSNLARPVEIIKISDTDNGDVSFTFSSSKKNKDRVLAKRDDRGYRSDCTCGHSSERSSALDTINRKSQTCFQKLSPSAEDTLSVLLEQKLKELNSQEENEMPLGGSPLKRTSAMILQELISALSVERSFDANDVVFRPTEMGNSSCYEHTSGLHPSFQDKQKRTEAQVRYSNDSNNNNMSPLSVLEASIANESCLSSSVDDGLVHLLQIDFIDLYEAQQLEPGVDRLHGATSLSKGSPCIELVADFVNSISSVVCSLDLVDSRLKRSKLAHAEEVILNAELVFGNTFRHNSDEIKGFSVCWFIVNELETLGSVLWTNFGCFSESEDTEGNLLKGFLFDCVIEYLDSRYLPSIKGGIKFWRDLPLSMNHEMLIAEVVGEIRRWTSCANFLLDEIMEREMSKWSNFDVETFETSVAIDEDILHSLVDEIVIDFCKEN
ncbi:Futsch light chain LC(F) like [Heracleum sosnowskyi]|uniref:Futsch light chain LC(F) like n=1 Tax=Heracleum sosnowskyi TaxID=360622 RepID=A0AAD8H402_9APIA|nr:Futsch light chain LC(F) like [Heracleum sosnowskyi]